MSHPIMVPELGESVSEATILRWRKAEGDSVAVGDILLELETEKVNLEVGADRAGVLEKIEKGAGADVKVGDVIGAIGETPAAGAAPQPPAAKRAARASETGSDAKDAKRKSPTAAPAPAAAARAAQPAPAVPVADSIPNPQSPIPNPPARRAAGERREERTRMSRRRQTIARRLVEAQHSAAMLTTFNEVDMSAVMDLRARVKDAMMQRHGLKLGITSFFVKAAIHALGRVPELNAEIDGDEIVRKHYYDIGVAMDAEGGLVVPVLRDADGLSIIGIEHAIQSLAGKVNNGALTLEDLRGGCLTISNGGVFGSLLSTPILNPPQVGIVGLHKIEPRPIAVDGQVVIRPMMYVALSYDHRLIDGRQAVQFLVAVKEAIEEPLRMWIEE
jgi:2-oxoglutarate dehydrogenase E2 component (dihydrolipoamide succinyltransferase)